MLANNIYWIEAAGYFLIALGAMALLAFLACAVLVGAGLLASAFRHDQTPRVAETTSGPFVNTEGFWIGSVAFGGENLVVVASDVRGAPNPVFVNLLPSIVRDLSSLELKAREFAPEISAEYRLVEISDNDPADFLLGFTRTPESDWEVVSVYFKARAPYTLAFDD